MFQVQLDVGRTWTSRAGPGTGLWTSLNWQRGDPPWGYPDTHNFNTVVTIFQPAMRLATKLPDTLLTPACRRR